MSLLNPTVSFEAIVHQDDKFFKELAALFRPLCLNNLSKDDIDSHSDTLSSIEVALKKRTNISISLKIESSRIPNAWVYPPNLTKNHVFYQDWLKEYYTNADGIKSIKQSADKRARASLDRKRVWVDGFFATLKHEVAVTLGLCNMCSAEEVAAVFLHEIGHVWSYYELLSLTAKTNAALRTVRKEFLKCETQEQKTELVMESTSTFGFSAKEIELLKNKASEQNIQIAVINSLVRDSYSEIGFSLYDQNAWEFASDQFSVRMGSGAYIVEGLAKMSRKYYDPAFRSLFMHVVGQIFSVLYDVAVSIGTLGLYPLIVLLCGDPYLQGEVYDSTGDRFTRVRNELIGALREGILPKDQTARVLDNIKTIDRIMKDVNDRHDVGYYFWAALFPSSRRNRNQVKIEQALERLANNDLYIAAAELQR